MIGSNGHLYYKDNAYKIGDNVNAYSSPLWGTRIWTKCMSFFFLILQNRLQNEQEKIMMVNEVTLAHFEDTVER